MCLSPLVETIQITRSGVNKVLDPLEPGRFIEIVQIGITALSPEANNDNIYNGKLVKTRPPTLLEEKVKNYAFWCSFDSKTLDKIL